MELFFKGYIPSVIVVGNVDNFRAALPSNRPVNIVGAVDANNLDALQSIINQNAFDYIIFTDHLDYLRRARAIRAVGRVVTADFFIHNVRDNFYSYANDSILFRLLFQKHTHSLLDVDAFFDNSQYYIKPAALNQLTVEGLRGSNNFAINDNFYARVYNSAAECRFRHYNVVLLTAERDVDQLRAEIDRFSDAADEFIVFVRNAVDVKNLFDDAQSINAVNGRWLVIRPHRANSLAVYVVSHKLHSVELPEGYKTIHAGRALGSDLGYLGDDSGDNISTLNPYLNELTALYWVWHNAPEAIVGIAHYRRFFSNKGSNKFHAEDILTAEQARQMLNQYDMIIGGEAFSPNSQSGLMVFDAEYDATLAADAINLIKKMLERHQPNYVDSFEQLMCGQGFMCCNMMITRKYVFDAYCQWLFSFILPAAKEFIPSLENVTVRRKRILGFIAERMFGVWLLKNHLRLREFTIMVDQ